MKKVIESVKGWVLHLMPVSVTKNVFWLYVLNLSNIIIPYLILIYITRVLSPSGYGTFSFVLAFIGYFQTIIDYGFNLTGARQIAKVSENPKKLSHVYSSIMSAKFLLFGLTILPLLFLTFIVPSINEYRVLVWIMCITLLGYTIMPTWLYQGMQKVKSMTLISVLVRTVFVVSVFIFVNDTNDVWIYALLYGISFFAIGIVSIICAGKIMVVQYHKVSLNDIKAMLKDGYYVFTSSIVISISGKTGILMLGLFYTNVEVGYYSGAIKIAGVITALFQPISQALFPYFSNEYGHSFHIGYNKVIKLFSWVLPVFFGMTLIVVLFRDSIVQLVLGNEYVASVGYLAVLAFLPILSIISNMMGTQILVASGHNKEYSRAFLRGSIGYVFFFIILTYFYATWGTVVATILGEIFCLIMLGIEVKRVKALHKKGVCK